MRRVPGLRRIVVAQALPVVMADHRRPLAALRPVAAGAVLPGRERGAVRLGAGQDVVHVRRIAAPVDHLTLFGQGGLLGDVVLAVQLSQILRDDDALGVLPGTAADAVARVDGAGALCAQIRVPGLGARARGPTDQLAPLVRPRETPDVPSISGAGARAEDDNAVLLVCPTGVTTEHQHRDLR